MMADRTLNTLLKEVFLKGFVVIYESQSPTQNKAEAIQNMLEAGEFVRSSGHLMNAQQLVHLSELSNRVYLRHKTASTRWRDVLGHPVQTIMNARDFKQDAAILLEEAKNNSTLATIDFELQRCLDKQEVCETPAKAHMHQGPQAGAVSHGVPLHPKRIPLSDTSLVPAHGEVAALPSAPIHTSAALDPGRRAGGFNDGSTYFQSPNALIAIERGVKANIDVDAEGYAFVRVSPGGPPRASSASVHKGRKVVRKTRSIFSVSGPARMVPHTHPSTSKAVQQTSRASRDEDRDDASSTASQASENEPTYRFQFEEDPEIIALAEEEVEEVYEDAYEEFDTASEISSD